MTVSSVALARDNTEATLTLSSAMTVGTAYTVTMKNLTTVSGNQLPASQTFTFTYALGTGAVASQATGSVLWEYYGNIGSGTAVSNLTSAAIYPNCPTTTGEESSFEAPYTTRGNINYGERLRGYIYPPTTGYYIFTISSGDGGQLWLSSNASPANLVEIAQVETATGYRDWSNVNNPNQTSTSIYLTAGQPYYIMALEKHGTRQRRQPLGPLGDPRHDRRGRQHLGTQRLGGRRPDDPHPGHSAGAPATHAGHDARRRPPPISAPR